MNSAISLEKVSKNFGTREVLKGISFAVERGDIFGYLGPNGAGKTTIGIGKARLIDNRLLE
jgi:ABC-2 type transport system ATP-binding protein